MGIRVLVVDRQPLLRLGVIQTLAGELANCAISQAGNAAEAIDALWKESWDLVVLDLALPDRDGLDVVKDIKAARPKLPVLVLTAHPESLFATRALRSGAAGYLSKDSSPNVLVQAVRRLVSGGKFITPAVAERLAADLNVDTTRPRHELLSDREYDVFVRIASGQTVGEIASSINLSVKTVSTYRTRILSKMGLKNNAALAQYAIRNQLVQ